MGQTITQVDAFTDQPFAGNPAAVCVLPEPRDERWMQNVAREMNLSETAFLLKQTEGDGFSLRWFTPATEVDLCGHATLASAHVLWEEGYLQPGEQARFYTRSGLLTAQRQGDWIEMNFPTERAQAADLPPLLIEALALNPQAIHYTGKNRFDYLLEIASEELVRVLQPDMTKLAAVPARGIIVTSLASQASLPGIDFVSRFFAPQVGVNEDPVTGSAHCCLAPYWSARLNKESMTGYQASPRGGIVRVRMADERVYIGGQAVTVMRGELL